jgi:hypothetical protein
VGTEKIRAPIVEGFNRSGRAGACDVEVLVLAASAAARDVAEREVDCPLGAAVLAEMGDEPRMDPALHLAARRILDGRATILADEVFVDAIVDCCRHRLLDADCPLRPWLRRRAQSAVPAGYISPRVSR